MNTPMYPDNVCLHGNGFIQISLGGDPHETRIHIWHPELLSRVQTVNTATHNHRFGFTSTVLRSTVQQEELDVWRADDETAGPWTKWQAALERLPTGNRPLMKQEGLYCVAKRMTFCCQAGDSYSMPNRMFHRTTAITDIAVTLMTKTAVLPTREFSASVLCSDGLEPDQEFNRFQVPFENLEKIMMESLMGTPFKGLRPWHDPQ